MNKLAYIDGYLFKGAGTLPTIAGGHLNVSPQAAPGSRRWGRWERSAEREKAALKPSVSVPEKKAPLTANGIARRVGGAVMKIVPQNFKSETPSVGMGIRG